MQEVTPRVTAPYLEGFAHKTVRILGKVTQLRGEQATIDAGGQINIHLNRVSSSFQALDDIVYTPNQNLHRSRWTLAKQ